jgi:Icc-related predicted phosphoesterase
VLIVSDVHGEFAALARAAASGVPLLVLGDLLNLMDYRTGEGMVADVLGLDFARASAARRAAGDFEGMRALWVDRVGDRTAEVRAALHEAAVAQYEAARDALAGAEAYVTYGNVDRPELLRRHLPEGARFLDAEVVEIEGVRVGFVGGGVATPLRAEGEVTDEEMRRKLERLGPVDVLCSHLPPAVPSLHRDVVTGRPERASRPILDYLRRVQPPFHFFGDVHQPQAGTWRVGRTRCQNVGYFRATRRPFLFEPGLLTPPPR